MSAVDFRRLAEVGPADDAGQHAYWAATVEQPTAERPIELELSANDQGAVHVAFTYDEAGELFDTLSQAMGIVVAAHGNATAAAAVAGLDRAQHDTPSGT